MRFLAMSFTQLRDPLFHRVQIVTDRARVAHFATASFLGRRSEDTVFVDIQSKIEFFFHWCVCLFELLNLQRSGNPRAPAVGAALLHLKKASSPRKYMNGKHTLF